MTTSVIIINWNSAEFLRLCIQSVLATTPGVEMVVIDNASSDNSMETAGSFLKQVDVIRNSVNLGFAAAVNQGFAQTSTAYVLVLNPDIRVMPGAIDLLARFLDKHPRAGAIGGYVNEKYLPRALPVATTFIKQNLGLSSGGSGPLPQGTTAVEQPAAAALMIRRDAYDDVAGFDERFYPAWYEDVDFAQKLKSRSWEVYFSPEARFQHEGGYSAEALGKKGFAEAYYHNQFRYAQKHFGSGAQWAVRVSIATGMLMRMAVRPSSAGAYVHVLWGALRGWKT